MQGELIIAATISLPVFLGLLFRVSTSHIFFSLMAGELLGRYFGHDIDAQADNVLDTAWHHGYGEVVLIVLPMILTAIFLRNSTSKGKILLHVIPLLITGVICAAFVLPVLPESLRVYVESVWLGEQLLELNRIIIGVMIGLQLVWLWLVQGREKFGAKKHE